MKNATKERSWVDTERDSFSLRATRIRSGYVELRGPEGETHAAIREPNPESSKNFAKFFRAKSIAHLK
jgi:hypothetical protein